MIGMSSWPFWRRVLRGKVLLNHIHIDLGEFCRKLRQTTESATCKPILNRDILALKIAEVSHRLAKGVLRP